MHNFSRIECLQRLEGLTLVRAADRFRRSKQMWATPRAKAQALDYIALRSPYRGSYHFFVDNVRVLRADGSTKAVVWEQKSDTVKLRFRFRGTTYSSWEEVSTAKNFPFSVLEIR